MWPKYARMNATAINELTKILSETREYLARPDANFDWSSWPDQETALAEIDGALARLRDGHLPTMLAVLFVATGPIQEVALSSGWGNEFLKLANRFDECAARARSESLPQP